MKKSTEKILSSDVNYIFIIKKSHVKDLFKTCISCTKLIEIHFSCLFFAIAIFAIQFLLIVIVIVIVIVLM